MDGDGSFVEQDHDDAIHAHLSAAASGGQQHDVHSHHHHHHHHEHQAYNEQELMPQIERAVNAVNAFSQFRPLSLTTAPSLRQKQPKTARHRTTFRSPVLRRRRTRSTRPCWIMLYASTTTTTAPRTAS